MEIWCLSDWTAWKCRYLEHCFRITIYSTLVNSGGASKQEGTRRVEHHQYPWPIHLKTVSKSKMIQSQSWCDNVTQKVKLEKIRPPPTSGWSSSSTGRYSCALKISSSAGFGLSLPMYFTYFWHRIFMKLALVLLVEFPSAAEPIGGQPRDKSTRDKSSTGEEVRQVCRVICKSPRISCCTGSSWTRESELPMAMVDLSHRQCKRSLVCTRSHF